MTIRNTFVAGLLMTCIAMPAMAWERTDQTSQAANGTPLVKMVAERGDTLGEPWLEYLQQIGYDVSGNWWVTSAQSLLDLNPDGAFVPGTYYGIAVGSSWWLPDVAAMQAAASTTTATPADSNPFVRQGEFVALRDAYTQDLAALKQFQQDAETRLGERITAIEAAQAATATQLEAATGRIGVLEAWRTQTDDNLAGLSAQVSAAVTSADQAMTTVEKISDRVGAITTGLPGMVTTAVDERMPELTLAAEQAAREAVANVTPKGTPTWIALGLAALAFIGVLFLMWKRKSMAVPEELQTEVANLQTAVAAQKVQQDDLIATVNDEDAGLRATHAMASASMRKGSPLKFVETSHLQALNKGLTSTWILTDGQQTFEVRFTKRPDGRFGWSVPRNADGTGTSEPVTFTTVEAMENKLMAAYEKGRLQHCVAEKALT